MCLACGLPVFHDHPRAPPKHHLIGSAQCRSRGGKQPRWQAVMSAGKLLINKLPEPNATATATAAAAAAAAAGPPATSSNSSSSSSNTEFIGYVVSKQSCCSCCCWHCCCCCCCCYYIYIHIFVLAAALCQSTGERTTHSMQGSCSQNHVTRDVA